MTPNSTHLAARILASVLAAPSLHSADLLGYWDFDDPLKPGAEVTGNGAPDLTLSSGATQTPDAGGTSGKAGDRGLDTGGHNNQGYARTSAGPHFDQILNEDAFTIVLWQFNRQIADTSSFWIHSPQSLGQGGIQASIPWGDGTLHFDQSGCCGEGQRLSVRDQVQTNSWQHFAFRRDSEGNRDIFVDGRRVASAGGAAPLDPFDGILTIGAEGPNGDNSFNGIIDEFAIFAGALTDKDIADLASEQRVIDVANPARPSIHILDVEHYPDAGVTFLTWESAQGQSYQIRKSTDLTGDPLTWPVISWAVGWQSPSDYTRALIDWEAFEAEAYYVVVEVPQRPFFKDDFETDKGWTTGINDGAGNTTWERGAPSNVGPSTGAGGSTNCFGTNLDGDYGLNSDIFLRSPDIGITGSMDGYRLTYQQFTDIETASDFGSVELYDSWTMEPLGVLEQTIDGSTDGWVQFSTFWGSTGVENGVVIEFRFTTDDSGTAAGWYIDNVRFE